MRPQFFPWLFDDRNAWEKSLADPRWSYELPMENFMTLYQTERRVDGRVPEVAVPVFAPTMMPIASAPISTAPPAFSAMPTAAVPVQQASPPPHHEEAKTDGILSQDEIDALLSGL